METGLFIGELAKRAQVSIDTIRYYEKLGLLPKPARTASGYRFYRIETLDRLAFIRQAQALNLSLAEIAKIVQLHNDRSACFQVQTILEEKITEIDNRLATLNDFRQTLMRYLSQCRVTLAEETHNCCPVLEDIAHSPQPQPIPMRKKGDLRQAKKA
jgi:DNA-binding transcriptional MerR regulator